jgi:hypothetical protein
MEAVFRHFSELQRPHSVERQYCSTELSSGREASSCSQSQQLTSLCASARLCVRMSRKIESIPPYLIALRFILILSCNAWQWPLPSDDVMRPLPASGRAVPPAKHATMSVGRFRPVVQACSWCKEPNSRYRADNLLQQNSL